METLIREAPMVPIVLCVLLALPHSVAEPLTKPPVERMLGSEDSKAAALLQSRIDEEFSKQRYDAAATAARELLELRSARQGADHWQSRNAYWQAETAKKLAAAPEADLKPWRSYEPLTELVFGFRPFSMNTLDELKHLRSFEKQCLVLFGPDHPSVAVVNHAIGETAYANRLRADGVKAGKAALDAAVKAFGEDHPLTLASVEVYARALSFNSENSEALKQFERALVITQRLHKEDSQDVIQANNNLGVNLRLLGKYEDAQNYLQKALLLTIRLRGDSHAITATVYTNVAQNLSSQKQHEEAVLLHRKAVAILSGLKDVPVEKLNLSYSAYARTLEAMDDDHGAELLYRRVYELYQTNELRESPFGLSAEAKLALHLAGMGKYAEAEQHYLHVLGCRLRLYGEDNVDTNNAYGYLATLYLRQSRYAESEAFYLKVLEYDQKYYSKTLSLAQSHSNVANALWGRGEYADAIKHSRAAVDLYVERAGEDKSSTMVALSNLGILLKDAGRIAEAKEALQRGMKIAAKLKIEKGNALASLVNNLAATLAAEGKYAEAEPHYRRALELRREALGPTHPDTALIARNLASNFFDQRKEAEAIALLERVVGEFEAARQSVAAGGFRRSEYGRDNTPYPMLAILRIHARKPVEAWTALESGLARGFLDSMPPEDGLQIPVAPAEAVLAAKRDAIETEILDRLTRRDPTPENRKELERLRGERDRIAKEQIAVRARASQAGVAGLAEVQKALREDEAIVLWAEYASKSHGVEEAWGCVLRKTGDPIWERLPGTGKDGAWNRNDGDLAGKLRKALEVRQSAPAELDTLARRLHEQRIQPLRPHLKGVRMLHVVAVNEMSGIPVELLTSDFTVAYVPSATVLARIGARPQPKGQGVLAFVDPTFTRSGPRRVPPGGLLLQTVIAEGAAAKAGLQAGDVLLKYGDASVDSLDDFTKAAAAQSKAANVDLSVWRESAAEPLTRKVPPGRLGVVFGPTSAKDLLTERNKKLAEVQAFNSSFEELPGTRAELALLRSLHGEAVRALADENATKANLDALRASGELRRCRYLHFATHGVGDPHRAFNSCLVLSDTKASDPAATRLSAREVLEAWRLDAELVTLSACQTASGRSGGGDGPLGFAQAFLASGSRSVCLTLWMVNDTATLLLMDRFYRNLAGKREGLTAPMGKAAALAEAKHWLRNLSAAESDKLSAGLTKDVERGKGQAALKLTGPMIEPKSDPERSRPWSHPRYWAAFVLIGDAH